MKNLLKLITSSLIIILFFNMNLTAQIFHKVNLTGHVYAGWNNATAIKPVAGAIVSLHNYTLFGDSTKYIDTTDANGSFEIDSLMPGTYKLTCMAPGYLKLTLKDFEVSSEKDSVNLFLHDTLQATSGIISGTVTYLGTSKPVFNALLKFKSMSFFNDDNNYSTTTDSMGNYSEQLPAGKYLVTCRLNSSDSTGWSQGWNEDMNNTFLSKTIEVGAGDTVSNVDFQITKNVNGTHTVTFTGNVESNVNTPVANAKVKVWTSAKSEYEWDDGEGKGFVATTMTDSAGNYKIKLDSISQRLGTFVIAAFKEGYKTQFYNQKNTFYTADLLVAVNDTVFSGLNFNLTQFETAQKYSIGGTVTDSAGMGINNAFIIAKDSATGKVRVGVSDSSGDYTVKGLTAGSYYVMFTAAGYIPQFYSNAYKWEDAKLVTVDTDVVDINALLIKSGITSGSETITGEVYSSDGNVLSGVLITAKNSFGITVGWAITDGNGSYTINGIAGGNVTITASSPQYTSQEQNTTLSSNSNSTTVNNFTLNKSVTSVKSNSISEIPSKYVLKNNYPNPFNPSTTIQFNLPETSQVRLDIYNILGQKVAELVNQKLSTGHYSYRFNASNLSSGVYLYRLEAGNFVSTKKMILSK